MQVHTSYMHEKSDDYSEMWLVCFCVFLQGIYGMKPVWV